MTDPHQARTLLAELDSRQDEVLDALDGLNVRVEHLIGRVMAQRKAELAEPAVDDAGAASPADRDGPTFRLPEAA